MAECPVWKLVGTKASRAEADCGVPGLDIESCVIADSSPPACPVQDAHANPPAAEMLVCIKRRETTMPAILRRKTIFRVLIRLKKKHPSMPLL